MELHNKILADIRQAVDGVRFTAEDGLYVEGDLVSVEVLALRGDKQQARCDLELRINPYGPDPSTPAEIIQEGREAFASMLFKDDASPAVRTAAALAAGRLRCDDAVRDDVLDTLNALLKDDITDLGLAAAWAIGELSDNPTSDHAANPLRDAPELVPLVTGIAKALHGDDPQVWQRAVAVAEDYHHRTAEDVLTALLGDQGDRRIRCQAIRQLEALSCPSVPGEALACVPFVFTIETSVRYVFTAPQGHARISGIGADREITLALATDCPALSGPSTTSALAAKSFEGHDAGSHIDGGCSLVEVPIGADMLLASVEVEPHQVRFRTNCKWLGGIGYTLRLAGGETIEDTVQLSEDADGVITGLINRPELAASGWKVEFRPLPLDPNDEIHRPARDGPPADG